MTPSELPNRCCAPRHTLAALSRRPAKNRRSVETVFTSSRARVLRHGQPGSPGGACGVAAGPVRSPDCPRRSTLKESRHPLTVDVVRRNPADQGKGFVPQSKRRVVEHTNGTLLLYRRLAREYDHRPDTSVSRVYWASIANMTRRLTPESGLARHPRTGRMNINELLADLQAQHDETTAQAGELCDQIERLTSALAKTEERLADLATARKVIAEVAPAGTESEPSELTIAYQVIVNAFNTHPDQAFRVRELHELLGMPTDDPAMNVTSPAAASDASPVKASSLNPDAVSTGNGLSAALRGLESARSMAATLA
ncbi:hypothetical protein [Streptomyces sp. AcE210]|uniref:hypothetical protein n=1 Tax=Streptomyces sp. AcE210 TaxID=2292703 RepID=UPI001F0C4C89|nr:hypothetical protein [Streptomyces sp. AcE210]